MDYSSYANGGNGATGVISFIVGVIMIVAMWKLFEKGNEAGWKSIIPVYNCYTWFKMVYGTGWKFLLLLIPIVNIVIIFKLYIDTAKMFGQSTLFGVAMVFFPYILMPILAFSK